MKNLLINAIATVATSVINEMNSRKEIASARRDMFDFCNQYGYSVTEVMHLEPIDFMRAVESAAKESNAKVVIKYRNFPVTYNRLGNKERTNWSRCGNVITVHSGKAGF